MKSDARKGRRAVVAPDPAPVRSLPRVGAAPAKQVRQRWRERAALNARGRHPDPGPSSEALLQFLYRSPIGMVQTERDGRVELMTPVAAQLLLALSPDSTLANLFTALDRHFPALREQVAAPHLTGRGRMIGPLRQRVCVEASGGLPPQERWISLCIQQFDGGHLLAHLSDVTAEVLEETAAVRSHLQAIQVLSADLGRAIEVSGLGMSHHDLVTGSFHASPRLLAILGLPPWPGPSSPDELIRLVHPEDRAAFLADRAAACSGISGPIREFRCLRAGGETGHVIGRRYAEIAADGTPIGLTSFFLDVTDLRTADRDRRSAAERLALATQAAGLGTFTVSRHDGKLILDAQARRLLGDEQPDRAPPEGLIDAALGTEGASRFRQWLAELPEDQAAGSIEFEVRRPQRDAVWLTAWGRSRSDPQFSSDIDGVIWDVTEHRAARQALEARRLADASNRAKSLFLARLGHELRTPLSGILGICGVLRRAREPAEPAAQERWLRLIEESGHHLLTLINDLLDRSRVEIGELRLKLECVDLVRSIESVRGEQVETARVRGVRVTEDWLTAPPAWVMADRTRLRQVLSNLLSNAIKYNRPQGRVVFQCERREAWWLLRVIDNGIGIDPDRQPSLFEPFNRLGREGGPVGGIGLGLSITRQLVEAMGGELDCSSEPEVGSTFTVKLPAGQPADHRQDRGG